MNEMKANELLYTKISYYGKVRYNKAYKTITLYEWIGKYSLKNKSKIDAIRQLYDTDKEAAKKMKADNLPCVTITGLFNDYRRVDLAERINPLFVIDIDRDDNFHIQDWDELKRKVASLPYVFLTSYSCSGKGLYCIIYFNINLNIENMFNALQADFKEMNINIDKSCKDITRLRFISYDDNILIRQGEIEMYNKEKIIENNISIETYGALNETDAFTYKAIYHLITKCHYQSNDYSTWLQDGFRLATFGEYGYLLFMLLSMNSAHYDKDAAEEKFKECQRTSRYTTSSLIYYFGKLKQYYGDNWKGIVNEDS